MTTTMATPDRIRSQRHCTAMAPLDTVELLGERVRNLLAHGRRITTARRYTYIDRPPEMAAGLTVGKVSVWRHDNGAGVGVQLNPGLTAGFGFSAYPGEADIEADAWYRYHADPDNRRDLTEVTINGGLPGDGPARDDQITIRYWNTHGVCDEVVVAFDPGTDLRGFVEWCASLDRPDPEPTEEGARQSLTVEQIAKCARQALGKE